jgi:sodium/bile acid cotransporter 7
LLSNATCNRYIKGKLKLTSDVIILAIIYNTFCNTFKCGFGVATGEVTALAAVLGVLLVAYKAAIFFCARAVGLSNKDTVTAVFMGSQKTLAFGLPLIKALFEGSPDLVWFCLPALIYHPMQIALGSALVPRLRAFAAKEEKTE